MDTFFVTQSLWASADYEVLAQANSLAEFQAKLQGNQLDLEPGTPVKLSVKLPAYMPVAGVANLFGAERWAELLNQEVIVEDVHSLDAYNIEVVGITRGTPVLVLVAVIAAALITLGIAYTLTEIKLSADRTAVTQAQAGLAEQLSTQHPDWTPEQLAQVVGSTSPAANQPTSTISDIGGIVKFAIIGLIAFAGIQAIGAFKK